MKPYTRPRYFRILWQRLHSVPRLLQIIVGPRQVGKTTLALQLVTRWEGLTHYETADQPSPPTTQWILDQWDAARRLRRAGRRETLLVLDEIQKIPRWSEVVKRLTDEDHRAQRPLRVVLLGSSALLMQRGLAESLAGRFELHRHPQWSFAECHEAFGLRLADYLFFGGYPGALRLRRDEERWQHFIRDALIETVLSKDVLLVSPVTKPALLRQAFGLAVTHPAEIISYQKMLGTLQDAGNTTTIASYLRLLNHAFLICPLERYSGARIKQRGSIPKLVVLDNALVTSMLGIRCAAAKRDPVLWGRLTENAVGAQLYWLAQERGAALQYWRHRDDEVDYVWSQGSRLVGIEVKSSRAPAQTRGLQAFQQTYPASRRRVIAAQPLRAIPTASSAMALSTFFKHPRV